MFFAPAGQALGRYCAGHAFAAGTVEAEFCTEINRRLAKLQYLWDRIHRNAEVMTPAEPDEVNLMDAFAAIGTALAGGPDLLLEIELDIETAFYNAWRIREAAGKLPGAAFECPKVSYIRNQVLEHATYLQSYATVGVELGSGVAARLGIKPREGTPERVRGHSFDECMTEFRDRLVAALER